MKINLTFECSTLQKFRVSAIIKECILTTLREENINTPCEINVLITNNVGIRGINNAYRNIDRHTDVLSFPMFDLIPGEPPVDWADYIDPDTGLCPLGDMAISLEQAISQAKEFGDVADITGIVLTKLDGTAKGGIAITVADEFDMPVKFIGVGEGIEDMIAFDPEQFIGGIFDE